MFKETIITEMKEVFKEIPFGIEHTLKAVSYTHLTLPTKA